MMNRIDGVDEEQLRRNLIKSAGDANKVYDRFLAGLENRGMIQYCEVEFDGHKGKVPSLLRWRPRI